MPSYPFVGGPCDGRRSPNLAREPADGTIIQCGGAGYQYNYGNRGVFVWLDVGGTGAGPGLGTHAPKGWADLQRAVNRHLPTALVRSRAYRRAATRQLAR